MEYSTYLGGTDYDLADHIAVSPQRIAVILGQTRSFDFPVTPDAYERGYYEKVYAALRQWVADEFPFESPYYSNAEIPALPLPKEKPPD